MKIVINARHLAEPYVGIGQHLRMMLFGIAGQLSPQDEIILLVPRKVRATDIPTVRTGTLCVEVVPELAIGHGLLSHFPLIGRLLKGFCKQYWEQIQVSRFAHSVDADVLWLPYPCLVRRFGRGRGKSRGSVVITVHDLIPWELPEYFGSIASRLARYFAFIAVRRADLIITVSETVRTQIADFLHRDDIIVTTNALPILNLESLNDTDVLFEYGVNKPYAIYVGGYDLRKRVSSLAYSFTKATDTLSHSIGAHLQLVLVGGSSRNSCLYEAPSVIAERHDCVKHIGFVSDDELAILLRHATCLVHNSVAEGFNIPILFAQHMGCPVIARDIPINREVAPHQLLGKPTNPEWLCRAIGTVHTQRDHFGSLGMEYAKNYSALKSASIFMETLRDRFETHSS